MTTSPNQRLLDLRAAHLEKMKEKFCQPEDDSEMMYKLSNINFYIFQQIIDDGYCDDFLLGKMKKQTEQAVDKWNREYEMWELKDCRETIGMCRKIIEDKDHSGEFVYAAESLLLTSIELIGVL